jgi:hypothetical protein
MSDDEVTIDFSDEPMIVEGLGRLPNEQDARDGQEILERVLIRDAVHDAQIWADMFVRWDSDWDPQESGANLAEAAVDVVEGGLTGNELKLLTGTLEGAKEAFVGFWMDGAYARYKGNALAFRHDFYREVGTGAAVGLGAEGSLAAWHDFLLAAQAGAWERIDALDTADKQRVAARAFWKETGLPTSLEEWTGSYNIGFLSSGIAALLRDADADAL